MAQLFAERLFDLPTLPAGWQLVAIGIGPRFEVLLLTREGSDGPPFRYRVYENRDRSLRAFDLHAPSAVAYQFIQPIGEGNLFLASAWTSPGAVGAGHVWTRSGKLLREVDIGEGIEDVQATSTSEIWVSRFSRSLMSSARRTFPRSMTATRSTSSRTTTSGCTTTARFRSCDLSARSSQGYGQPAAFLERALSPWASGASCSSAVTRTRVRSPDSFRNRAAPKQCTSLRKDLLSNSRGPVGVAIVSFSRHLRHSGPC